MINTSQYDHYKDSDIEWIGEIPRHWEVLPYYSLGIQSKLIENNDSKKVLSLSYGNIVVKSTESNKGLLPDNYDSYQTVETGDIILRLTDLQNDKKSLRVGFSKLNGIITSVYLNLRVTNSVISNQYLYRYLYSCDILKIFYFMGGGVRQSLSYSDFRKFPIPLPPLSEQKQIVSYLDEKTSLIDEMVEKKKRKIELLKEYRTSLINTVVTKGLNPDVPMKDSGIEWIGEIPKHWELKRLKHVSNSINGYSFKSEDFDLNKETPVIRIGDVGDVIDFENIIRIDSSYLESKGDYIVKKDDMLIGLTGGTIGKTGKYNYEFPSLLNQRVGLLRNNSKLLNNLLYHFLKSKIFMTNILFDCYGGGQDNISMNDINNIRIPLPPLIEQEQIVSYLDEKTSEIDKTIELENKKIELLKEYRQSLISNVVTGKIKVVSE